MNTLTHATVTRWHSITPHLAAWAIFCALCACTAGAAQAPDTPSDSHYEYKETQALVGLVNDAAKLIETDGEAAFIKFRAPESRWRQGETYVFVLDPDGHMLVHPDPKLEGKLVADLKDVNGRPIVQGLIRAATAVPTKPEGWYHYEWPVPGGLLPRWKSSYVRLVKAPSGKHYIVGSGMYNDRMERPFVVDLVKDAVGEIEKRGESAFPLFHDRTGPFIAKDAYIFVTDPNGVELVNPAFPSLEGRNLIDVKDTRGKQIIREMLDLAQARGSGWVDYMWPKPGESVATEKSAYVSKANVGGKWLLVGAGVYLPNAPKAAPVGPKMTPPQLMALVREGAAVFEKRGEEAFPDFREKGSKWLRDDTYFFVLATDGTRIFNPTDPAMEHGNVRDARDARGRPYGKMFLEVAASPSGEGWVHYMYPEPGGLFPAWKSTFLTRVKFPSGKSYLVGAGAYNMQMDKAFIEDVVNRAAALVADRGKDAFGELRDKSGPFVFLDTYVFVTAPDGTALVNAGHPSLDGTNMIDARDLNGKPLVRDYIAAAQKDGTAWVEYTWYKPGDNTPSRKQSYVKLVRSGGDTYIVGSGFYPEQ